MKVEEWIALKSDELVQKLFHTLKEEEELRKQAWSEDMYTDRENYKQIGFIEGLRWVRNGGFLDEEDLQEEE